jgi:hypothetical protein
MEPWPNITHLSAETYGELERCRPAYKPRFESLEYSRAQRHTLSVPGWALAEQGGLHIGTGFRTFARFAQAPKRVPRLAEAKSI